MARGMGTIYKTTKCICDNPDMSKWSIVHKTTIKSGKNFGKVKALVYCETCNHQWETSAKYIEQLKCR